MRCNTSLTKDEINRYSRQIRLAEVGKEGQEKIKGTSVLVVGAGALGCPVLQYLTVAGIGTLGIVDNDWVDESNLNRQVLYTLKDLGKPKPLAAKEKLKLLNPEVTLNMHFIRLDKLSALKIISQYDIIVDCTDNFASRYLINDACVILNKPLVYGAIHKFSGQLMVLNYHDGPTLRCLYPEPPHPLEVPSCEEFGVIGSVPGLIGSLQATEVFKIILGLDGVLSGKLFMIDTLNFNTWISTFERNPDFSEITKLSEYEDCSLYDNKSVKEISAGTLSKMLSKNPGIPIIDLRDKDDKDDIGFKTISIPHYDVSRKIKRFSGKEAIVFYCRSGSRSTNVINYLQKVHKMENLYNLIL
jgi:molybdopterin/thiamine biosynthesis adenylyltransferase/rhodanese-related sulfurtransferase